MDVRADPRRGLSLRSSPLTSSAGSLSNLRPDISAELQVPIEHLQLKHAREPKKQPRKMMKLDGFIMAAGWKDRYKAHAARGQGNCRPRPAQEEAWAHPWLQKQEESRKGAARGGLKLPVRFYPQSRAKRSFWGDVFAIPQLATCSSPHFERKGYNKGSLGDSKTVLMDGIHSGMHLQHCETTFFVRNYPQLPIYSSI